MKWIEIENQGLLFTEEEMENNPNLAKIVSLNASHTESTPKASSPKPKSIERKAVKDCCIDCPLRGLCDDDDCGNHLFRLDTNSDPLKKH